MFSLQYLIVLLAQFIAAALVISIHEFAHAYSAYKCGDPTARFAGRMTLNPLKHFDPLGIVLFAIAGFGWAKPVPINPDNFRDYKKGSIWTSAAGILANYLTAFLVYPLFVLVVTYVCPLFLGKYAASFLYYLFYGIFAFSLNFCIFNLLPFYPLDGFRLVEAMGNGRGKIYWFLQRYGYSVLLGLIFLHILSDRIWFFNYIDVLGYVLTFAVKIFGRPITALWDWIFRLFGVGL